MEDPKSKIKKQDATVKTKKLFDICSNYETCFAILSSHIHLKGAITMVEDNETHQLEMNVPSIMVL